MVEDRAAGNREPQLMHEDHQNGERWHYRKLGLNLAKGKNSFCQAGSQQRIENQFPSMHS